MKKTIFFHVIRATNEQLYLVAQSYSVFLKQIARVSKKKLKINSGMILNTILPQHLNNLKQCKLRIHNIDFRITNLQIKIRTCQIIILFGYFVDNTSFFCKRNISNYMETKQNPIVFPGNNGMPIMEGQIKIMCQSWELEQYHIQKNSLKAVTCFVKDFLP